MLIRLIVVVGLYMFVGNSGILSFGHIAFMCIGAYAAAWATWFATAAVTTAGMPTHAA